MSLGSWKCVRGSGVRPPSAAYASFSGSSVTIPRGSLPSSIRLYHQILFHLLPQPAVLEFPSPTTYQLLCVSVVPSSWPACSSQPPCNFNILRIHESPRFVWPDKAKFFSTTPDHYTAQSEPHRRVPVAALPPRVSVERASQSPGGPYDFCIVYE